MTTDGPDAETWALLAPAMRRVLAHRSRVRREPLHAVSPTEARKRYTDAAGILDIGHAAMARVEDFTIPARDGFAIPVRLFAPTAAPLPVLVYFHGGGFTIGSIATHESLCRQLAHLAGCAVLSVDYRLAPEHVFPTAHNDAWDALQWVAQQSASRGLRGENLAVGGDSAGGTLAAACAIEARDAGLPLQLQLLFYPGTAGHQDSASHQRFGQGFVLETPDIDYFFGQYLRSPADRHDWRFAPLDGVRADGQIVDLSDVAPAWIGLAECDPLVDEGIHYGDRLRMHGVPVSLEIYAGVVHEFIKMGRALPQALQAHRDAANALKKALFRELTT